jgi:GT2 family glycosyltransferase
MGQAQPTFSIIILTYARPLQLAARLQAIACLAYSPEHFKVIVVNDSSDRHSRVLLELP